VARSEVPFIVVHEYLERRLMREEKLHYDQAHEICSGVEWDLRKRREPISLLSASRDKLVKRDLAHLNPEFYEWVLRHRV
jgi:hypothetical protein